MFVVVVICNLDILIALPLPNEIFQEDLLRCRHWPLALLLAQNSGITRMKSPLGLLGTPALFTRTLETQKHRH